MIVPDTDTIKLREDIALVRAESDAFAERTGRSPAAHLRTFGCQQNVADGERLRGLLAEMGYTFTDSPESAELILYNTCAVREGAEDRVFGNVGALRRLKRRSPHLVIGLCGCMVQQKQVAERIRKSFPYVDLLFGPHAIASFPALLHEKLARGGRHFSVEAPDGVLREDLPVLREGGVRAWLPIMYGCDNFCTYCVVPLVRGRERSREPQSILAEARELVAQGYREITLLGQNVNSYGKTLAEPYFFARLLREIDAIPGDFIIRFMTSHPKDCTRELIDAIACCGKVERHLHLPVQSGSDRILEAMNRRYTAQSYRELLAYARRKIPGIAFTSDIIVGFPGETRGDFERTLELVREIRYHALFTFVYSRREGTRAAEMDDPVPHEEKMLWFSELLETQKRIGMEIYAGLVGKSVRVLAEGRGKTGGDKLCGRTSTGVIAEFPGRAEDIGCFFDMRVTEARNWAVFGEIDREDQQKRRE